MDSINEQDVMPEIEIKRVTEEALAWPAHARDQRVTTVEEFQQAAFFLQGIKAMRKRIESAFGPVVKDAHRAWHSALRLRGQAEDPLKEAEKIVKQALSDFRSQWKAKTVKAQKKMEAEAKRLAKAQGIEVPVILLDTDAPVVNGVSFSDTWTVTVESEEAFFKAAVRDKGLRTFLKVDIAMLQKHVVAMKGQVKMKGVAITHSERVSARSSGD